MSRTNRWTAVVPIVACCVAVGGCKPKGVKASETIKPAQVVSIEGTLLHRVTLTSRASERLDIQLAQVEDVVMGGAKRKVVPYGAVLYDAKGDTWVYTSPEALVFVRQAIAIDYINGDRAVLSSGPATGTKIVTVGAAELFGAEFEIGH
jgi:hypothetical protein